MAFDVFAFFAVIFFILAATAAVAIVVYTTKKGSLQVGDLVRTTFTGCPAVLTTALFGVNGEYANAGAYGTNFEEDAADALHCDMAKGVGTFSTWISDGGQNFKLSPIGTNSQLYLTAQPCSVASDCSETTIPCGPGYFPQPVARDPKTGEPLSSWFYSSSNPALTQCPENSYCDVCAGPPSADPFCSNPSAPVGTCVNLSLSALFSCTQVYSSVSQNYCAVVLPVTVATPPVQRFNSCSIQNNYESLTYIFNGNSGTCGLPNPNPKPYFCNYEGNPACLVGQECVQNWSPSTGWCPNGGPGACGNSLSQATYVCSGTIYPTVAMQTQWIAEGVIQSIGGNGSTFNIAWTRVQNTYPGIGPSLGWCEAGTANCSATANKDDYKDRTWVYSDCRYLLVDDPTTNSRHNSVSLALLGTDQFNPLGLSIFSSTDAAFDNINLQSLLFVSISSSGAISNNWSNTSAPPYKKSAWNLQSVAVPKNRLEKIFFYSIHPWQATDEALGWHALNYS